MTFYEWVVRRRVTDTPAGDFVTDAKSDQYASKVLNTKAAWLAHLRRSGACKEAVKTLHYMWHRYTNSYVYEQSADVGFVYFIQSDTGLFKIGLTNGSPYKRLASIQTNYPGSLSLYGYIETNDPRGLESFFHQKFSDNKINGEWFSLHPSIIETVLQDRDGFICGETPRV